MSDKINAMAPHHLPGYIVGPDGGDWLFTLTLVIILLIVVGLGVGYLTLHSLPERMAHRSNHKQIQLVAVLGIIALFTNEHVFWIAALILAIVPIPDMMTPLRSIASSLEAINDRQNRQQ